MFEELVSHEELFACSGDVSVVVEDSHAGEPGDVDLHGDVLGQVSMDLGLLGRVHSGVDGSGEVVESFVSDFVDHLNLIIIINNEVYLY